MMKKGAIFDMDGLMFDTEQVWQSCWSAIADEMHVELDPQFRKDICGTSGAIMCAVIEKYYHVEDGHDIMGDCIARVHASLETSTPEKPGVHEILEWMRENGFKIAVASSSSVEQIKKNLKNTNTESYVDAIVSGASLPKGKPHPDIFLRAAELLELPPEECYVFEDAYNGVRAGHASGACTIMIPDTQPVTDEMRELADGIYENLIAAKDAIAAGEI